MRPFVIAVSVVALALPAAPAGAADEVENPEYKAWAAFPKGTTIRTWVRGGSLGRVGFVEQTKGTFIRDITLAEVGADKLVLEDASILVNGLEGTEKRDTVTKREVPKKLPLPAGTQAADFAKWGVAKQVALPDKPLEEADKPVKVPAGEYKCRMYMWAKTVGKNTDTATAWLSDAVPGGVVRTTVAGTGFDGKPFTLTTELVKVTKP